MDIDHVKRLIPEYAKDLRLNLSAVLTEEGSPGLLRKQSVAVALASAAASRNAVLLEAIGTLAAAELDGAHIRAARAAASIMAMNNVYYRFLHLVGSDEYASLPARLRMNVVGSPGVDKTDFELYSLAVSAINGCVACVGAHGKVVRQRGGPCYSA